MRQDAEESERLRELVRRTCIVWNRSRASSAIVAHCSSPFGSLRHSSELFSPRSLRETFADLPKEGELRALAVLALGILRHEFPHIIMRLRVELIDQVGALCRPALVAAPHDLHFRRRQLAQTRSKA